MITKTACCGYTSSDAAPAFVAVATQVLSLDPCSHQPSQAQPAVLATPSSPSFDVFLPQVASSVPSLAAVASASSFIFDAATDHSREAICRLSCARLVHSCCSSFEPSSDLDSAANSPCTPSATPQGDALCVTAGTATLRYHRGTQCGVLPLGCTHFAAAAHRIQQPACFVLQTSSSPPWTAAVGAWEAHDARNSNTRAGEGLRLAEAAHVSACSSVASLRNFTPAAAPQ